MAQLLGEKLRLLRLNVGLTQTQLATRLGLASHGHITNLETGKDVPSLDLVIRIAHTFGVTTDYLLRDSVDVAAPPSVANEASADMVTKVFGSKLRSLRVQQQWTQVTLMRQLGLARQGYISNLEAGRKMPSLELVVQIADLFGLTTDQLLYDDIPIDSAE